MLHMDYDFMIILGSRAVRALDHEISGTRLRGALLSAENTKPRLSPGFM